MIKEQALSFIQSSNSLHIRFTQREIKYGQVLLHPFFVGRFRNYDHIGLKQKPQGNLCSSFAVLFTNSDQHRVSKAALFSFGKRPPGFMLYAILFHIFMCGALLLEHVCFHLIDHRCNFCKLAQIDKAVRIKIGHTDSPQLSLFVCSSMARYAP